MDTDMEIRRDEYYRDHLGMCGTCRYCKANSRRIYYCDNRSSYWYGEYVDAKDGCDDWEGKYVG